MRGTPEAPPDRSGARGLMTGVSPDARIRALDIASPSMPFAVDDRIAALGDWRGRTLASVRQIVRAADPDITETVKWGRVPVWERAGIITTGEVYQVTMSPDLIPALSAGLPSVTSLMRAPFSVSK